ncbi:MAG: NUDIX hydrolase [Chloroflexales bacterium]|nr:NUDIX hydrolase [Chloroflexales bacterium]
MSDNNKHRPWRVLRRETLYESQWVSLHRDDVRLPDGSMIAGHHVVDFPRPAVCVVPCGDDERILMIEHYRFITDITGWELPAGWMEENEDVEAAAMRELREETGYHAREIAYQGFYYPAHGSTNLTFHVCLGLGLKRVGDILDTNEVLRAAWFSPKEIWAMIDANEILDGQTLTALLWHFARAASVE